MTHHASLTARLARALTVLTAIGLGSAGATEFPIRSGGSFDADRTSAQARLGAARKTLELPGGSHLIALEPDPGQGFDFHKSILEGSGFKLVIRDPHGRDHLDYGTLKIIVGGSDPVPGTDTTAYVLSRLVQGVVPYRDESPDTQTQVFRLLPDPAKLMQGHDVFAIPYNGDWRIEVRICDLAQNCFNSLYKVYFGPFVATRSASDGRCTNMLDPMLHVSSILVGNIGRDAPRTGIYVGLASADERELWTFYHGDFGDGSSRYAWWQGKILPFGATTSIPSGFRVVQDAMSIPDWISVPSGSGPAVARNQPFPGGSYKFITAAVDTGTGAYRQDEHAVTMCDH